MKIAKHCVCINLMLVYKTVTLNVRGTHHTIIIVIIIISHTTSHILHSYRDFIYIAERFNKINYMYFHWYKLGDAMDSGFARASLPTKAHRSVYTSQYIYTIYIKRFHFHVYI